jgi:hypothetical protein
MNVWKRHCEEQSDEAIQTLPSNWIASPSLSSGGAWRRPVGSQYATCCGCSPISGPAPMLSRSNPIARALLDRVATHCVSGSRFTPSNRVSRAMSSKVQQGAIRKLIMSRHKSRRTDGLIPANQYQSHGADNDNEVRRMSKTPMVFDNRKNITPAPFCRA